MVRKKCRAGLSGNVAGFWVATTLFMGIVVPSRRNVEWVTESRTGGTVRGFRSSATPSPYRNAVYARDSHKFGTVIITSSFSKYL